MTRSSLADETAATTQLFTRWYKRVCVKLPARSVEQLARVVVSKIMQGLDAGVCPLCASGAGVSHVNEQSNELRQLDEELGKASDVLRTASDKTRRLGNELTALSAARAAASNSLAEFEARHEKRLPGIKTRQWVSDQPRQSADVRTTRRSSAAGCFPCPPRRVARATTSDTGSARAGLSRRRATVRPCLPGVGP